MQRIINLTHNVSKPGQLIYLNREFRKDIVMWQLFLDHWNGVSLFLPPPPPFTEQSPDIHLDTDAAGSIGFGAFFDNQWFQGSWLPGHHLNPVTGISISWQELYPIYLACMLWGPMWANRRICFHCDNQATVSILSTKTSRIPRIMHLVRLITLQTLLFNFTFTSKCVPGVTTCIASSMPDPSFPDQSLTVQAATYIFKSIATSTRLTYSTGERHFIQFCLSHKLISPQHPFLPAHESTLIHFVTHLSNTVSYGTIKVYLAAINNLHIEFGCPLDLSAMPVLHKTLRGIKLSHGTAKKARYPITSSVLHRIHSKLQYRSNVSYHPRARRNSCHALQESRRALQGSRRALQESRRTGVKKICKYINWRIARALNCPFGFVCESPRRITNTHFIRRKSV